MPIRSRNATARALASGSSGGGNLHALPFGVCWTILGTLISAAWAGFGRFLGWDVTMVMMRSYVWAGQFVGNQGYGVDEEAVVSGVSITQGVQFGRKPKLTPHQQREAVRRRDVDGETLRSIGRSYNVSAQTISRLAGGA
jgi:hypothetical protein